jgi:hypothetical protein
MGVQYRVCPTKDDEMRAAAPTSDWIETVSARLQRQWPSLDPQRMDDVALALWRDENLRAMDPDQAADKWLTPAMADQ